MSTRPAGICLESTTRRRSPDLSRNCILPREPTLSRGALLDVAAHLQAEIAAPDPWRLQSNPFEHQRYASMLNAIRSHGRIGRALEIGCAAGVFSELLAPQCDSLHIVDIMPDAIRRTLHRLNGCDNVTCEVASIADDFA